MLDSDNIKVAKTVSIKIHEVLLGRKIVQESADQAKVLDKFWSTQTGMEQIIGIRKGNKSYPSVVVI